jgi:membrane fusion protein
LSEEGSVSRNVAHQQAAELLEQEARLNGLDGQRLGIERDITALTNLRSDLPLQNSRDTTQTLRGIEELKQQSSDNEARRQLVVRAEVPGRFTGMLVGVGQAVSAEQRLASLLPQDSRLEAELYVPTRAAGFVRPGTPVLLRYDAFPYQKFGQFRGRVRDVSMTTVPLSELQQAASASPSQSGQAALTPSEPVYRVRVQIDAQSVLAAGHAYPIKPGMQLSATLVLEHRTLVEWVLEPVFGLSSRL